MRGGLAVRLLRVVPVALVVSLVVFFLVEFVPGDPATQVLGPNSSADDYYAVRQELGLDQPWYRRYLGWLGHAVRGDLGRTLVPPVEAVGSRLARALPVTVELALLALLLALVISVPAALLSASRPGGRIDRAVTTVTFATVSLPSFLVGLLLLLVLSYQLHLFPEALWVRPTEGGWIENLKHAFLPALTIALPEMALMTRVLRSDLVVTLQQDFVLFARAKGMPRRHVLVREALRPASFSLVTLLGISLGRLIGGTIVVETLFSLPGMGKVIVDGSLKSDYTLVQGGVIIVAVTYVAMTTLVDVAYGYLDPRVRRPSSR